MARRSRRNREVDLFNFSFLDILACVIGLLIFILSIVVVSAGGSRSRQTEGRVANAEHQLQQARDTAKREADRREKTEKILKTQSANFANPAAAAAAVRAQISLLQGDTARLDSAASIAQSKAHSLLAIGEKPAVDPTASEVQEELRRLDEETADLRNRAADERAKAQANVRQVQFYVPHLREVNRQTMWVDVSGDRLFCIQSDDYIAIPDGPDSTRYIRASGATGTRLSAMVTGQVDMPAALSSVLAGDTVLEVAVHPDGYEAFRKLRKWAWNKGFSVNWVPHDEESITLTHIAHALEQ